MVRTIRYTHRFFIGCHLKNASYFPQIRIDKSSLFIAAIAPLLWIADSFRSAIFLNVSFIKELFFPEPSALFLRLWLVFFILIQAWFFNRYFRTKSRVLEIEGKLKSLFDLAQDALVVTDIEGRVVEASGKARELWGYSLQELSDLDLTRLCAASESERLINFIREIIKNKAGGLDNVLLAVKDSLTIPADIKGRLIDNLDAQDQPGIFLDISRHKSLEQPAATMVVKPEAPAEKAVVTPEVPVAKAVVAPEAPAAKVVVAPEIPAAMLGEERKRIESAIRQEEAKKSQEALKNLEQKYLELMRIRLAEECKKVEDAVRLEEKKKAEEQIRALGSTGSQAMEEKLKQERGRIEEAIKQEEAKKFQEQMNALEHKYSEILKARVAEAHQQAEEMIGQEAKRKYEEQLRQAEAKFASESGAKISEGRKLIEDAVRLEEQRKAEEGAVALKQKYEQEMQVRLADERKRIEEAVRQEADKRIEEENKIIREAVRQAEQKKALEATKEIEKKHAHELAEAAKKVDEQALIKAKELRSLDMGKMVKGLSLQVMNPLTAVLNNIKMMNIKLAQEADFKVADVKEAVNGIEENASLCKSILTSLSEVSGGSGSSFQPLSLNDSVEKIDALYGKELKLQSIALQKILLPNLPRVSGDPTLLFLVLFNMVSNAKWAINRNAYRVGAGTITIKTQKSEKEGFVELIISDNGVGITKQDLKHVFEPFFTTKKEGEGLGLGLAIVFDIIKAHKGEIHAETQIGSGAIFKIIFPALIET